MAEMWGGDFFERLYCHNFFKVFFFIQSTYKVFLSTCVNRMYCRFVGYAYTHAFYTAFLCTLNPHVNQIIFRKVMVKLLTARQNKHKECCL